MITLRLLFLILGFVCLVLSAFRVPAGSRVDLTALGLALIAFAYIVASV